MRVQKIEDSRVLLEVTWDLPEHVDLDEVIKVAEEMGYLPNKSGQEYINHLREDMDLTVMGTLERVRAFFNPYND